MAKRSSSHCLLSIYYVPRPEPRVGQETSGSQGCLCPLGSNRTVRVTKLHSTGGDKGTFLWKGRVAGEWEVVAVVATSGPWAWAPSGQVQWPVAHVCLSNFGILGVGGLVRREEEDEEKEKAGRKGRRKGKREKGGY